MMCCVSYLVLVFDGKFRKALFALIFTSKRITKMFAVHLNLNKCANKMYISLVWPSIGTKKASATPCCWNAMGLSGMLFGNLQIFQDRQTYCSYSTSLESCILPGWWLVCWLNKYRWRWRKNKLHGFLILVNQCTITTISLPVLEHL